MGFFFNAPEICTILSLICVATGLTAYRHGTDETIPLKRRRFFYDWSRRFFLTSGAMVAFGIVSVLVGVIQGAF